MSGDGKSHGNKFLIPLRGYSHGPTAKIGNTRHKEKRDGLRTLRRSVNVRTKEGSAETSLRGLGLTCSKCLHNRDDWWKEEKQALAYGTRWGDGSVTCPSVLLKYRVGVSFVDTLIH